MLSSRLLKLNQGSEVFDDIFLVHFLLYVKKRYVLKGNLCMYECSTNAL